MSNTKLYFSNATETSSCLANFNYRPSQIVTSSASANATSTLSQIDADEISQNIAQNVANSTAQNNANIISQAVDISTLNEPIILKNIEDFKINIADIFYSTSRQYGIGPNVLSLRIGSNSYKDWSGDPNDPNINSVKNISLGNGVNGSLVNSIPSDKISVSKNVAIGNLVLGFNQAGNNNVCIGHNNSLNLISGSGNTAIGYASQFDLTTGNYNVSVGLNAGNNTNGNYNTHLGHHAGRGDIAINSKNPKIYTYDYTTCVGASSIATGNYQIVLGTPNENVYSASEIQINCDERNKTDISSCKLGLDFIMQLKPTEYSWLESVNPKSKDKSKYLGFLAQDIENIVKNYDNNYGFIKDNSREGINGKSVATSAFIPIIVNAIQELYEKINSLKN